ncbi:starch-binding protein [Bacteroidia bacterium]|nr:starch-binding protein [Bacteroidia bacterium]
MKNMIKYILSKGKKYFAPTIIAMFILPSCSNYLDIVPDKTITMDNLFSIREEAYNALARAYSYMPHDEASSSTWLLGDEWVNAQADNTSITNIYKGIHIMRGLQNAGNPILGTWSGTNAGSDLYEGINICNIFLGRIDGVHDMTPEEIADWKAQVLFLKAYYHFLLLKQYGPIIIMDEATSPDAEPKSLYVSRSKLDDCFDYIVKTMDAAIPDLQLRKEGLAHGQVDKLGATAMKAKVLLWRASPFYSGNTDYFDFYDHDGKPFFPQDDAATTKAKWKNALDAIEAAIKLCEDAGAALYTYEKRMPSDDFTDSRFNPNLKTVFDLRHVVVDPWNQEYIWGLSNVIATAGEYLVAAEANIVTTVGAQPNNVGFCRNTLGATYKTLERFYTKHGLPLDEDNTFDRDNMHKITVTPDTAHNKDYLGILQSDVPTISLYLEREPRFYANLGITGGYWRSHSTRISTSFYNRQLGASYGGNNRFWTGIGAQKLVHPSSTAGGWIRLSLYPIPIIRMADLYLMKAEARNEYLDAPDGEVWAAINKVRERAGIPSVEAAYTGAFVTAEAAGKHTAKSGMREIILNERGVEFAFEGSRFWDMLRYKRAPQEFSSPVIGWDYDGVSAEDFFQQRVLQERKFTLRDCLWPLPTDELNINSKLIQNPGW